MLGFGLVWFACTVFGTLPLQLFVVVLCGMVVELLSSYVAGLSTEKTY